jgi:hypothetical protein
MHKRRGAEARAYKLANPQFGRRVGRAAYLFGKYRITEDQFEQMSAAQGHKCAICLCPSSKMFHKKLNVDHCHKTGVIRGLLCSSCNSLLGRIGDDVAGVRKVLEYMSKGA